MTDFFKKTSTPQYSEFIHLSRYARWLDSKNRRETWEETVSRYIDFFCKDLDPSSEAYKLLQECKVGILNLDVMPSMRCLMTAGPALERDNVASFNCSYVAIDHPRTFDEIMYILMCGTGVGFSVERQYVNQLPEVAETFHESDTVIVVADSKIGWASAFRELVSMLYAGKIPKSDFSKIRPAGARLKTFGGRASGPKPLQDLFSFSINLFKKAAGRKLTSIECHDLVCKIAEIVVVGGVRRSALISLSNVSDDRMRGAKSGQWWLDQKQRALANNSAAYTERPDFDVFLTEIQSLYESKSGERGIFSRVAATKKVASTGRRDPNHEWGTNPCSEIILRPNQFCNLSEVIIRSTDTLDDLLRKVRLATILGTVQSSLTNFRYLRKIWKKNTEEERLLGVSLTGIMDHPVLGDPNHPEIKDWLQTMHAHAIAVNQEVCGLFDVGPSTALTCVKPSGCRPGDALTSTSKGLLTLEELMESHTPGSTWSTVTDMKALQGDSSSTVTQTFDNGVSPVVELTLSYNMTVESTPNHQWFVKQRYDRSKLHKYIDVNQWVRADSIQPGDILDVSLTAYNSEIEARLQDISPADLDVRAVSITQPSHMTPDLAWLVGYLYGDGCLSPSKHRIRFIDQNVQHLEKAQRLLKNIFGLDSTINCASEGRDAWVLEKGSASLYAWLVLNGFDKNTMTIPRKIRESSRESIVSFFAGLIDSDGCIFNNRGSSKFTISTAYDVFAKQLQDVGWAVGLGMGRSLNTKGVNLQDSKHMWLLTSAAIQADTAIALLAKHSIKAAQVQVWHHTVATKSAILGKVVASRVSRVVPTYDVEVANTHWYYAGSVKSHNTVSQLTDTASGIHPRFAPYYVRTVRADKKDPLAKLMADLGFPHEEDVMNASNWVFSFPVKAPESSRFVKDVGALEQLALWEIYQDYWCDHKPSATIYYTDNEFLAVAQYVWSNFDKISGVSFLPVSDHVYQQAPYQAIDEATYKELLAKMPTDFTWDSLALYETEDGTTSSQTLACTADGCESVDLTK